MKITYKELKKLTKSILNEISPELKDRAFNKSVNVIDKSNDELKRSKEASRVNKFLELGPKAHMIAKKIMSHLNQKYPDTFMDQSYELNKLAPDNFDDPYMTKGVRFVLNNRFHFRITENETKIDEKEFFQIIREDRILYRMLKQLTDEVRNNELSKG